jgi:hypothetical protein
MSRGNAILLIVGIGIFVLCLVGSLLLVKP